MYLSSSFPSEELHSCSLCSSVCHVSLISLSLKSENESGELCLILHNPMDYSLPGSSVHGISRQDYWSGQPFPSPGDLLNSGIKLGSLTLQADSLPSESPGKSPVCHYNPTTSLTTSSYKDPQSLLSWSCSCPAPPAKETELSIWLQFTSNHCLNCPQLLDQINLFHFYSLLDGYFSVTENISKNISKKVL